MVTKTLIIIACCVFSAMLYICGIQFGYLIGKRRKETSLEDKYWDMCRQIAHYDDELETIKHPFKYGKNFEVEFNNVTLSSSALKDIVRTKEEK